MSKFQNYLKTFDITSTLTEEDIEKTMALLQIYGPTVRRTAARIDEFEEECYESRRQSISDFINLAIDYDRDTDRKRISDRLAEMGHSMELLSVMEEALVLVKDTPPNGGTYYSILQARYFDVYCTSNEDAFLNLGMSSSTYYRHIKPAIRAFAASLWCVVIPDLIIKEHLQNNGSQVGVLAPGTHSHFESGKFSQFWPEPGTNPAQWVRLKTPFRVHPKQPN